MYSAKSGVLDQIAFLLRSSSMHWKKPFHALSTSLSRPKLPCIVQKDDKKCTPVGSTSSTNRRPQPEELIPPIFPDSLPSPSDAGSQDFVITHIRASDITVDLGRIPVGFYVAVESEGTKQRTRNKPILVRDRTMEWEDEILLLSELSSTISLRVCASYELSPMLGNGETLRTFFLDVHGLFRNGEVANSIDFSPPEGAPIFPCSLLHITVERRGRSTSNMSTHVSNHTSIPEVSASLAQITDEGHEYLLRYRKHKKQDDLKLSIVSFERVLQAYPHVDQCRAVALFNLASAHFVSCQDGVTSPDFDVSITFYRDALDLRPIGHPDRPATLLHLARVLDSRFRKWGNESYTEEARNLIAQVKSTCPLDSFEYQLADGMLQECTPNQVTNGSTIVALLPIPKSQTHHTLDHMQEPAKLNAQAFRLSGCFEQGGQCLDDINGSITIMEQAVKLTQESNLEWALRNISLGVLLLRCFSVFKNIEDLERTISVLDKVAQHVPHDHPDRPIGLISLGSVVFERFGQFGQVADLDKSLSALHEAMGLITDKHPNRSALFIQLGAAFLKHYQHLENPVYLNTSISLMEEAKPSASRDGIGAYSTLVEQADLSPQFFTRNETLNILLNSRIMECTRLLNLGMALNLRFQCSGDRGDLEKSIMMQEEVLKITPQELKSLGLANLGSAMALRHASEGNMTDLQESISLLTEAVQMTPNHHPYQSQLLVPLSQSLQRRFDRLGQIVDIDKSISMEETALQHVSNHDSNKPSLLSNLSLSFFHRFKCLSDLSDLNKATSIIEEAVHLTPVGHPKRAERLTTLGATRTARFERLGHLSDLNGSIATLEEAAQLISNGGHGRIGVLANLAGALLLRSMHLGNMADLEKSISAGEEAVLLSSNGNPILPRILNVLGRSFLVRFMRLGNVPDLDKSISTSERAFNLTPEGHSGRPMLLGVTSISLWCRFLAFGSIPALRSAISYSSCAARSRASGGQPSEQFHAFKIWFQCAISMRRVSYPEANQVLLEAFECGISLFPQLAWLGLPFKDRYTKLVEAADITQSAVSLAVSLGHLSRAVEWLEQGRCVVWGQSLQLHTPLDELRHTYPDIADQYESLSSALQHSSTTRDESLSYFAGEKGEGESLEQQAQRHRELVVERENLLQQIQALPGFEGFLSPKKLSQLRVSAHLGPMVMLNVGMDHSDALIVVADLDEPVHVLLPDINEHHAEHLRTSLDNLLSNDGRIVFGDGPHRAARLVGQNGRGFDYILSELWIKVVKPVLHALGLLRLGRKPSRIFWCPTGPLSFLPIHAAGNYDILGTGNKASDFIVSSYIPTLSVLSSLPEFPAVPDNIRLLAVPQPPSDRQTRLSGAPVEIEYIRRTIFRLTSPRVQLHESDGDVEGVLDAMENSDWVHFACHGIQDPGNPTDSGLCLADGRRLRLSDIIRLSRPRHGLAFLSACQTATGAVELSEEAVHLAASMLFAGYSSVIGTMWSIKDSVAPELAKDIYEQLFRDERAPDSREAARALHNAVERLRLSGAPFIAWVPFIHMGV